MTEDLINLKGRKYHSKRNHINNFLKTYEYEYVELNETNIEEALKIDEEWYFNRDDSQNSDMYPERLANREALKTIVN